VKDSFCKTQRNLALGHGIILKSGNFEQAMTTHLVAQGIQIRKEFTAMGGMRSTQQT
jgi:hypothetical protein